MNGIINVYKNKGMTSFDVVRKVRKISGEKKTGHTGTLDPMATGVLPVAVGRATKIIDYIMDSYKIYNVEFELGRITDTYDIEGKVLEEKDASYLSDEEILKCVESFKGEYDQVPPMYSALKKDGVRLYELARKGIEVEREARRITIYDITEIKINKPYVSMTVSCSKGTYIRSLCFDIGQKLNTGAVMTKLNRSATSVFKEENSINIEDLSEENIEKSLISIEEALKDFPELIVKSSFTKMLLNGVCVCDKRLTTAKKEKNVLYRVYDDKKLFIGLGRQTDKGFKMEKLLG